MIMMMFKSKHGKSLFRNSYLIIFIFNYKLIWVWDRTTINFILVLGFGIKIFLFFILVFGFRLLQKLR